MMNSEIRRRKDQLRNRLSWHSSTSQDISPSVPPSAALTGVRKSGTLLKRSSGGLLYPETWKKRLCVLTASHLYIYKIEHSSGKEAAVVDIDLAIFNGCQETNPKEARKTPYSFVIFQPNAASVETSRHVFAASSHAEMAEWLQKVKAAVRSIAEQRRHSDSTVLSAEEAAAGRHIVPAASALRSGAAPQLRVGTAHHREPREPRQARGRARRHLQPHPTTTAQSSSPPRHRRISESTSQPSLLLDASLMGRQHRDRGLGMSRANSSTYVYSSSEESESSGGSSRCSVVRRLNTTMPEIVLPRRSASPPATRSATCTVDRSRKRAAVAFAPGGPAESATGPVPPSQPLRQESSPSCGSGGASSTGSSSLSQLTSTLTREALTIPALATGLEDVRTGLQQLEGQMTALSAAVEGSATDLAVTRKEMSAVQGTVASLQALVGGLNTQMSAFSGMFRKVDEQLMDMWTEVDTVNNNVHHVMHEALEYQRQNEQLFNQLSEMRNQLMAAFPDQLAAVGLQHPRGSLTRPRHRRRQRQESERLCELDDEPLVAEEDGTALEHSHVSLESINLNATGQTASVSGLPPVEHSEASGPSSVEEVPNIRKE